MSQQRVGALLIHGLGGTEFDMGALHKVLARAGVEPHGVTLPGHAGCPEDLLDVRVACELSEQGVATAMRRIGVLVELAGVR